MDMIGSIDLTWKGADLDNGDIFHKSYSLINSM